jgi:hypothetical protein
MNATTALATAVRAFSHNSSTEQRPPTQDGVRRMWEGGLLRQFRDKQAANHYIAYSSPILKGYAGSYVCDGCLRPCAGVYRAKALRVWLCGLCRKGIASRPAL